MTGTKAIGDRLAKAIIKARTEFLAEHPNETFTMAEMYRRLPEEARELMDDDLREICRREAGDSGSSGTRETRS